MCPPVLLPDPSLGPLGLSLQAKHKASLPRTFLITELTVVIKEYHGAGTNMGVVIDFVPWEATLGERSHLQRV